MASAADPQGMLVREYGFAEEHLYSHAAEPFFRIVLLYPGNYRLNSRSYRPEIDGLRFDSGQTKPGGVLHEVKNPRRVDERLAWYAPIVQAVASELRFLFDEKSLGTQLRRP